MMYKVFFVICALSYSAYAAEAPSIDGHELQFVHAVIRIGDHTPSEKFLTAFGRIVGLSKTDFDPYGYSDLLPNGKQIMYDIGKDLSDRYKSLLNGKTDKTQVLSLDFDAAKKGMLVALDGLKGENFNNEKQFPAEEMNKLYPQDLMDDIARMVDRTKCPAYFMELASAFKASEKTLMDKYSAKLSAVIEKFKIDYPFGLFLLYELYSTYANTKPESAADWYKTSKDALKELSTDVLNSEFSNERLVKLSGGRYVKHFLDEVDKMKDGTYGDPNRKMTMVGGSGPFIKSILTAIAGKDGYEQSSLDLTKQYPDYGALFLVEVYKKSADGTYHLQVHYKNGQNADYTKLSIKGCEDGLCELGKLKDLLSSTLMTKDEADTECKKDLPAKPVS